MLEYQLNGLRFIVLLYCTLLVNNTCSCQCIKRLLYTVSMLHTINIYCRFHFLYLNSRGLLSMYVTHWCLCYISSSFWLSHVDVAIAFKVQTSKLKYFLLRNFRTTKMAIRNQNIQIYYIS